MAGKSRTSRAAFWNNRSEPSVTGHRHSAAALVKAKVVGGKRIHTSTAARAKRCAKISCVNTNHRSFYVENRFTQVELVGR